MFRIAASTGALILAAASGARAEALPGRYEVAAGGNLFALFGSRCSDGGDVVSCSNFWPFAGFELGFRTQATPWLSVGLRAAGGKDLDGSNVQFSEGAQSDRDLWLWRGSAEVRFDPPIWPRAIWFAGELGAAMFVDVMEFDALDDRFTTSESSYGYGVLLGLAVGWDIALAEHAVLSTELRAQFIEAPSLDVPLNASERVRFDDFPYVSLAVRVAWRW